MTYAAGNAGCRNLAPLATDAIDIFVGSQRSGEAQRPGPVDETPTQGRLPAPGNRSGVDVVRFYDVMRSQNPFTPSMKVDERGECLRAPSPTKVASNFSSSSRCSAVRLTGVSTTTRQ